MIGLNKDDDVTQIHFTDYVPPEWQDFFVNTAITMALAKGEWEGEMQLRKMGTGALVDVLRTTFLIRDPVDDSHYRRHQPRRGISA